MDKYKHTVFIPPGLVHCGIQWLLAFIIIISVGSNSLVYHHTGILLYVVDCSVLITSNLNFLKSFQKSSLTARENVRVIQVVKTLFMLPCYIWRLLMLIGIPIDNVNECFWMTGKNYLRNFLFVSICIFLKCQWEWCCTPQVVWRGVNWLLNSAGLVVVTWRQLYTESFQEMLVIFSGPVLFGCTWLVLDGPALCKWSNCTNCIATTNLLYRWTFHPTHPNCLHVIICIFL